MHIQNEKEREAIVEHKVRRRVGLKVLQDIRHQVDAVLREETIEKKAAKIVLMAIFILALSFFISMVWPSALRWLTSLINTV